MGDGPGNRRCTPKCVYVTFDSTTAGTARYNFKMYSQVDPQAAFQDGMVCTKSPNSYSDASGTAARIGWLTSNSQLGTQAQHQTAMFVLIHPNGVVHWLNGTIRIDDRQTSADDQQGDNGDVRMSRN